MAPPFLFLGLSMASGTDCLAAKSASWTLSDTFVLTEEDVKMPQGTCLTFGDLKNMNSSDRFSHPTASSSENDLSSVPSFLGHVFQDREILGKESVSSIETKC